MLALILSVLAACQGTLAGQYRPDIPDRPAVHPHVTTIDGRRYVVWSEADWTAFLGYVLHLELETRAECLALRWDNATCKIAP